MWFVLKRTIVVGVLLALACLFVGWWSYQHTARGIDASLSQEANLLAEHTARTLAEIERALVDSAGILNAATAQGAAEADRDFEARLNALPQIETFVLLHHGGAELAENGRPLRGDPALRAPGPVTLHKDGEIPFDTILGEAEPGEAPNPARLGASYAAPIAGHGVTGALAVTFDPFFYRQALAGAALVEGANSLILVDAEGAPIASTLANPLPFTLPMAPRSAGAAPVPIERLLSTEEPSVWLSRHVPVQGFGLRAFVVLPELQAFAAWRNIAMALVGLWLVAALGSAIAFYGLWRRESQRQAAYAAMEHAHHDAAEALERAEAANAAKSRFLAHMSHELRTPLNAILGFSEVIRDRMIGGGVERDSEYAALIHSSGNHLLQIINDLLDLSKIEAGKLDLTPEMIDVAELVNGARYLVMGDLREDEIDLVVSVPEGTPPLYADLKAARQMLVNLLSNAIKFSPDGGEIEVRAEGLEDGGLALIVEDQGVGIPEDQLSTVYEPFGQATVEVAGKGQGTGLGLPLVKSLIELHRGAIDLQSVEGVGTMVTLIFPPPPRNKMPVAVPQPQEHPEPPEAEPRRAEAS